VGSNPGLEGATLFGIDAERCCGRPHVGRMAGLHDHCLVINETFH
jgi:hypothetical protein